MTNPHHPPEDTTYLRSRPLPPNGHPHRMPPPPIRTHIPQPPDIILHLPPQVILDCHIRQLGGEVEDLFVGEAADTGGVVDVEFGHQALGVLGADAVEGPEGALGSSQRERIGEVRGK